MGSGGAGQPPDISRSLKSLEMTPAVRVPVDPPQTDQISVGFHCMP